ncbi:hypothetical protein ACQ859_20130 [Roseateles chitinivorans]|uniref:hypothetical protein n=1 Tax=Roseateles chitinivorans TaxID=2917965 RepID=UPI003D66EA53
MNLIEEASRIDGYLLAISSLKEDGTAFRCVHLGEGGPSGKASEVAEHFRFDPGSVELVSESDSLTPENIPKGLEDWMLNRVRSAVGTAIDRRLVSGLVAELVGIFQRAPAWFSVARAVPSRPGDQGAFWSIYVFGMDIGSCAIHCSWDD